MDYIIKSGNAQKTKPNKSRVGGISVYSIIKSFLAAGDVCCDKDVIANAVTADRYSITGDLAVAGVFLKTEQEDIGAGTGGAISVDTYFSTISTDAGGDAFTLADGTIVGQLKKIYLLTDGGGDGVVTVDNLSGGTTITFDDATDYIVLLWDGTNWSPVENVGTTIA